MSDERDRLEIDRVGNLVIGFGWKIIRQEFTDDKIKIELEKPRTEPASDESAGPT